MSDNARINAAYAAIQRRTTRTDRAGGETPNMVYGRLLEAVHISGYGFERACWELDWLLDDDRWKRVDPGYDDINAFLATVDLSPFNMDAKQRRPLVRKLNQLRASQRATSRMLGASHTTVQRDLAPDDVPPSDQAKDEPDASRFGTYVPPEQGDQLSDQGKRGADGGQLPQGASRTVLDMLQDALGPEHATESVNDAIKSALLSLVDALAWLDDNANRVEYVKSLAGMHRDDPEPITAAIITAANWVRDEIGATP